QLKGPAHKVLVAMVDRHCSIRINFSKKDKPGNLLPPHLYRFLKHGQWPDPKAAITIQAPIYHQQFIGFRMGGHAHHFVFATFIVTIATGLHDIGIRHGRSWHGRYSTGHYSEVLMRRCELPGKISINEASKPDKAGFDHSLAFAAYRLGDELVSFAALTGIGFCHARSRHNCTTVAT